MKKAIALLFCSLFIFSSCKKQNIPLPEQEFSVLFGNWKLVSQTGGSTGEFQTPETLGYTPYLRLTKKGEAFRSHNDTLKMKDQFIFSKSNFSHTLTQSSYKIKFKKRLSYFFKVSNDSLYLYVDGNDLYDYIYIQSKD